MKSWTEWMRKEIAPSGVKGFEIQLRSALSDEMKALTAKVIRNENERTFISQHRKPDARTFRRWKQREP